MGNTAYVVAGIGTDVGKTVVSAVLVSGLQADYWKPVQAGTEPQTDSQRVATYTGCPPSRIHPEAYCLQAPESPHSAAAKEGVEIEIDRLLHLPKTDKPLIIEGAGGLMVPLTDEVLYLDVIRQWQLPVILVSRLYLGAINHTLLSIDALETRGIELAGLVFCGDAAPSMEQVIVNYSGAEVLGRVPQLAELSPAEIGKVYDTHFVGKLV